MAEQVETCNITCNWIIEVCMNNVVLEKVKPVKVKKQMLQDD
jgi:hypothetical protein